MGRAAHSDLTGDLPLAPSPFPLTGEVAVADYKTKPAQKPRRMDEIDIKLTLTKYKVAADRALSASNIYILYIS